MKPSLTRNDISFTRLLVGLEIHVELSTRSKMFTRVANPACPGLEAPEPNTLVDPVVAALPGTLPVLNRRAVEMSVMVGMALECSISPHSKWDRKNYSYPDLPKGYQISQFDLPLCFDGVLKISSNSPTSDEGHRKIGITRAHLEEDTGKLGHELPGGGVHTGSLLDLNRAGTPLLEIVTEPDFDCADDVVTFARELRSICRFLGVTQGDMQRGHMRFEPNINVIINTHDGREYRTPVVEVKNLNSFKSVHAAIEFEHGRQIEEFIETGREMGMGMKSTRGWNDQRLVTVLQREKEDAHDYRYFPDPDLIPVEIDEEWQARIRAELPELPASRKSRYEHSFGLSQDDSRLLVDEREVALLFERAVGQSVEGGLAAKDAAQEASKLILNQLSRRANEMKVSIHKAGIDSRHLAEVVELRLSGELGAQSVEPLFEFISGGGEGARALAEAHGLLVVRDESAVEGWIEDAIAAQPKAAEDVAAGKDAAIGRLVGHVMKISAGQADAGEISKRLFLRLRP